MTRQDMEEQILLQVPRLADEEKNKWIHAEKLRSDFVKDYSPDKILAMQLDEFVIGNRSDKSFCYRLERETDVLGRILGSTAFKFGIYFGRTKSDPVMQYRFSNKWGDSKETAFTSVKAEIAALLQAASGRNIDALNANRLSPMFKGKLLFIYFPNEYIPIYSEAHLNFFVSELNLHANPASSVDMQRALMAYRSTWPDLIEHSAVLFMHFLYQTFPQVKNPSVPITNMPALPLLDQAIEGARFIDQIPPISLSKASKSLKGAIPPKKIDYLGQLKKQKRIGDRGEAIVLNMEERRLKTEGRPDLADKIKHMSDESDSEGYDILSYEKDGVERYIEVKATSAGNLDRGFFISINELEKSNSLPNYYLYIVFAATSKNPEILPIKEPKLHGVEFSLEPVAYHVTVNLPKY